MKYYCWLLWSACLKKKQKKKTELVLAVTIGENAEDLEQEFPLFHILINNGRRKEEGKEGHGEEMKDELCQNVQ